MNTRNIDQLVDSMLSEKYLSFIEGLMEHFCNSATDYFRMEDAIVIFSNIQIDVSAEKFDLVEQSDIDWVYYFAERIGEMIGKLSEMKLTGSVGYTPSKPLYDVRLEVAKNRAREIKIRL